MTTSATVPVRIILPSILLALLFLFTGPGRLHAQVTTGGITGRIIDSAGVAITDATVEIHNTESGLRRSANVNQQGSYTVVGLDPGGGYRVTIRAIGYRPEIRENVRVPLSQNARADAILVRQAVQVEELVVVADAAGAEFSPGRQGTQTTINDTLLRRLPTLDRDFTDFVKLTPQVQVREGEGGITAAGQNNRFNT
ncbi:MAG: carboxypeptidase-like regulatory domain-containing protein, partial [Gemmatimonadales bacterium]